MLGAKVSVPWGAWAEDYDRIRDVIAEAIPGFEDFNARRVDGFTLPHPPRDSRSFQTDTGKAKLVVNELDMVELEEGQLLLQTIRSHDQYNTTIYGLNDRYRGIKSGRRVVLVNERDMVSRVWPRPRSSI